MSEVSSYNKSWQILDRLRTSTPFTGTEFGVALSALIYLRWADFEEAEREAIAAFDGVTYIPVLPTEFHWRTWCNSSPNKLQGIFRELPTRLKTFANTRHNALATQLNRVARAVEKLSRFPDHILVQVIYWLADQPFETPKDRLALRDAFDATLAHSYEKSAGHFFTPAHVAALMAQLVAPKTGESVYDPCFGSAGLLTAALESVEHRDRVSLGHTTYASGNQLLQLAGIENNPDAYVIGLTRLVLSGVNEPLLEIGNSLERVPSTNPGSDGFDIVLANPPWGMKIDFHGLDHYPIETKDSSALFLQHAISQLRPGGRGVVVVPPSLLFRAGREQELREWLLRENTVEAVVSIPRGAFAQNTSIETCLLLFRRGGTTKSVRMANGEARSDASVPSPQKNGSGFAHWLKHYGESIRSTDPVRECWDVTIENLAEIDYDLTPKRRDRSGLELILDSLPKEAEIRSIKDCCTVMTGRSIRSSDLTETPPRSNYEPSGQTLFPDVEQAEINPQRAFDFADTPIPYIRIRDVEKGHATRGSSWLMPAIASTIEPKWKLRAGDILLSKSGTIGKAGIVRNGAVGAIAANGFFVIRIAEPTVDPHYLLAYLQSNEVISWLDDRARGATAKHLSIASIEELAIVLPSLQIQQRIAEQHRKFGVDAFTYLAELLTEDGSDGLASELNDWVSRNLKRVEGYEGDPSSQAVIELLEEVANSRCPINTCKACKQPYYLDYSSTYLDPPTDYAKGIESHCVECWLGLDPKGMNVDCFEDETPIGPWAIKFRELTKPLSGVSNIPDPTALVSVLQRVASNVRDTETLIEGNLPNQERARLLTNRVVNLINRYTQTILEDTKLSVDVISATEDYFGAIDIRLEIENRGRIPIRDVRFSMYPPMDGVEPRLIPYMQPGQRCEVHFEGQNQRLSDDLRIAEMWTDPVWSLSWTARDLAGDSVEGTRDLSIKLRHDKIIPDPEAQGGELDSSPYVCGDPVTRERQDVFFGREELLDQIKRQISLTGNVVLLEGNRRAGKSSILWHLEGANAVPGWLGIYCSLQGAEGSRDGGIPTADVFRGIAYEIVQSVRKLNGSVVMPDGSILDGEKKLGIARILRQAISEEAPFQDFREYLELVLETLAEKQLGLLLMLDEFDKLQEGIDKGVTSPQVPENIRFLVQSYPRFSAILTGSRRLKRMREEYWSALFGLGTRLGVTALPFEAASRLITEPVAGRLSFSKSAVNRAFELTAGQPYLLQCLCNRVFDIAAQTRVRSITVDHVNDAANKLVEDNEHFASLWDYTEFDRRRFLLYLLHREQNGPDRMRLGVIEAKLEEAGVELREEIVIADLESLLQLELIELHGESSGTWYSLTIPMMGQWLDLQQDYEVIRSRARAEAEDISGKLSDIANLTGEIAELEDSMDISDE